MKIERGGDEEKDRNDWIFPSLACRSAIHRSIIWMNAHCPDRGKILRKNDKNPTVSWGLERKFSQTHVDVMKAMSEGKEVKRKNQSDASSNEFITSHHITLRNALKCGVLAMLELIAVDIKRLRLLVACSGIARWSYWAQ